MAKTASFSLSQGAQDKFNEHFKKAEEYAERKKLKPIKKTHLLERMIIDFKLDLKTLYGS